MNYLLLSVVSALIFFASCNSDNKASEKSASSETAQAGETTYIIANDSTSMVKWKGVMLGIKEHYGTITLKEGTLTVNNGQLKSGSFVFDMNTIRPTDANYDAKSPRENLVKHLLSPDFFDVANHPLSTFTIDSVYGSEANGTLTIRGNSNKETLKNITVSEESGTLKASGLLTYNRKNYGVKFDMPMKELIISDDIEMTIELTGTKK